MKDRSGPFVAVRQTVGLPGVAAFSPNDRVFELRDHACGSDRDIVEALAALVHVVAQLLTHPWIPEIREVVGDVLDLVAPRLGLEESGNLVRHVDHLFRRHRVPLPGCGGRGSKGRNPGRVRRRQE